jgi:membrane associated rhomboid family serine protease
MWISRPIALEGREDQEKFMTDAPETQQNQPQGQREPVFNLPGSISALLGLLLAIHLARVFVLNNQTDIELQFWLAFIPYRFIAGEADSSLYLPLLWTPFTHALLHAGWEHLIFNCVWLAVFGTPVARRYGPWGMLILFLISAAVGAAFFAANVLPDNQWLIGASGGIAGLTGAACRFMFQPVIIYEDPETGERHMLGRRLASLADLWRDRRAMPFIVLWLVLNAAVPFLPALIGMSVGIAWQAHLGGFLAGLLLVPLLERRPRPQPNEGDPS